MDLFNAFYTAFFCGLYLGDYDDKKILLCIIMLMLFEISDERED